MFISFHYQLDLLVIMLFQNSSNNKGILILIGHFKGVIQCLHPLNIGVR